MGWIIILILFYACLSSIDGYKLISNTNRNVWIQSSKLKYNRRFTYSQSAIIAPPKVQPPKVDIPKKETKSPNNPDIIFKQNIDIEKEFEEYIDEDTYLVILYNDPVNKRNYVASVLMDVFTWDEALASSVMLEAHNNGFAVTGEYNKETAFDYVKKLVDRGLFAEARKSDEALGDNDSWDA